MKTKSFVLLVAVLFVATGCVGTYAPSVVLGSALQAIRSGNLKDFQETLSPELAKKIGNKESLLKFRAEFGRYQDIVRGDEILVRTEQGDQGIAQRGYVLRVYSEQVLGLLPGVGPKLLYTATVNCAVRGEGDNWPPHYQETQTCLIADLQ